MQKILTVPESIKEEQPCYVAGNHYVSLSEIAPDGSIAAISHIRESLNALVEIRGEPLFSVLLSGAPLPVGTHRYEMPLTPSFQTVWQGLCINQTIFAPEDRRGFVIRIKLSADNSDTAADSSDTAADTSDTATDRIHAPVDSSDTAAGRSTSGELILRCHPTEFLRSIFSSQPLEGCAVTGVDSWTDTAWVEFRAGGGLTAIAIAGKSGDNSTRENYIEAREPFSLSQEGEAEVWFYIGVGCELDGARLANIDLRRRGSSLYETHCAAVLARRLEIPGEKILTDIVNLNLQFCYNYSVGRALDTGELMLATSRSSRYYVSGAYWARDCMLWAFPALLRMDARLAKEALLLACTRYLERGADHALYLNGMSLYPGFELDELVAPVIALRMYVGRTGDAAILELPAIQGAITFTCDELARWRDEKTGLFRTELSPSDDPEEFPFLTYDNYLTLAALRVIRKVTGNFDEWIEALSQGLRQHCVATCDGVDLLAWSTDGNGRHLIYDNPPGSLIIIPYYGEMDVSDPVYRATVERYFSDTNPWFTKKGAIMGVGCEHAPGVWPMSLCNILLSCGHNEAALSALAAMSMDNGIACETVDADGKLCTGAAFATASGFLANSILEVFEL